MKRTNISYADYYNKYSGNIKGSIPQVCFEHYIGKAWGELEALLTSEYEEKHTEKIELTVCEIAETLYKGRERSGKKSENIDGYSVTYTDGDFTRKSIINIAIRNLGNTGLLYMGVER